MGRRGPRPDSGETGWTLVELLVSLALASVLLLLAAGPISNWTRLQRLRTAALEVVAELSHARDLAVRGSRHVAVRFRVLEEPAVSGEGLRAALGLFRDGDDDGVRNDDIDAGVDRPVSAEHLLAAPGRRIRYGFPPGVVPRDPSGTGWLDRLDDPIRFGNSDLASFGELGTATSGTVYLTDGHFLMAVRVFNRTGKVEVLRYLLEEERWVPA